MPAESVRSNGAKAQAKAPGKIKSGTVNVNEASLKELQTLPGIGTNILERIRGQVRTETSKE